MMLLALAATAAMPGDVTRFAERWQACEHWGGEPDEDPARKAQIERQLRALACARLERDANALRKRYRGQHDVRRRIDEITDARDEGA